MLIRTSRGRRRFPAVMTDSKRPRRFPTGVFPERKLVSGFSAEFLPVRRMRLQRRRFLPVQFPPKTLQHSVPESAGGTRGSRHLPRCASSRFCRFATVSGNRAEMRKSLLSGHQCEFRSRSLKRLHDPIRISGIGIQEEWKFRTPFDGRFSGMETRLRIFCGISSGPAYAAPEEKIPPRPVPAEDAPAVHPGIRGRNARLAASPSMRLFPVLTVCDGVRQSR